MFSEILEPRKIYYTIIFIVIAVYLYFKYVFGYWKRMNIFSPPRSSIFMGHFNLSEKPLSMQIADFHKTYKNHNYLGLNISFVKLLLVRDLDLIRNIISKDYGYFEGHGLKAHKDVDPLAQHLFNLEGEEWKRIRTKVTPTFTSSKMKYMFDTVIKCTEEMVEYINQEIKINNELEMKEITAKLGTNVIASCAFGLESNCFKNPNAEFRKYGHMFFDINILQSLFWLVSMFAPDFARMSRIRLTKKEVTEFMMKTIKETIEYREKNNVQRNDFLQLLIEMLNAPQSSETHLTFEELAAQVFVFFIAGYETSSTAAHYALMELAKNQEIREELVRQIDEAYEQNDNKITYDVLKNISLLNQVVKETLRMYPPIPFLTRRCTKNYRIPGTDIIIEKCTGIAISAFAIHHDPEIYPEPEKFMPERFSSDNQKEMHPYSYIPFGEGPRNCIGSRFGYMQLKLTIIHILKNSNIELSPKTELPIKFKKNSLLLHSENGIYIKFSPRK